MDTQTPSSSDTSETLQLTLPCVMSFNLNDPTGAGGLSADLTTFASASAHGLAVMCGTYVRDTHEIRHHVTLDEECVEDQARCALEDMTVAAFKVGFLGSAEVVSSVAEITSDYPETPVITYIPDLSWMDELSLDNYLDAMQELVLPQTAVLVGNHGTLTRWLLPDWTAEKSPSPRDLARAAAEHGTPYLLVTGIHTADQHIESHLASPETILALARFERFDATFSGSGDTLSAALTALLASGSDLQSAVSEAMTYLDQCLNGGFQPGMGNAVPDRMFWAHDDDEAEEGSESDPTEAPHDPLDSLEHPDRSTRH